MTRAGTVRWSPIGGSLVCLALVLVVGCTLGTTDRPARRDFNEGVAAVASGDLDGAETKLLAARDAAGQDPELRFRAAFELGLLYAKRAEGLAQEPEKALEALGNAAAWTRDALRLRPEDKDARVNLEVVQRRVRETTAQLNAGHDGLEARLGELLTAERGLRDEVRVLGVEVRSAKAASDPTAFAVPFGQRATTQRMLLTDAGALLNRAGDERAGIEAKTDAKTPEEQGRLAQLAQVEQHVQVARDAMAEARRRLQHLESDVAQDRLDDAVTALVRAQEQLQEPVAVIRALAQEQLELGGQTEGLVRWGRDRLAPEESRPPEPPVWLTPALLGRQQGTLTERTAEIHARLLAFSTAPLPAGDVPGGAAADPQAAQKNAELAELQKAAGAAAPYLEQARAAMEQAAAGLASGQLTPARAQQDAAARALLAALERFGGVKQVIDLAYGEQVGVVALLDPGSAPRPGSEPVPARERRRLLAEATARNQERLARLAGLLATEGEKAVAQAAQAQAQAQAGAGAGAPGAGSGSAPGEPPVAALYREAERLRALAAATTTQQAAQVPGAPAPLTATARRGLTELEDLRRLFFSILEHLKELQKKQAATRDRVAQAGGTDDLAQRQEQLGPVPASQREHGVVADALASALEKQAEQVASSGQQGAAEQAKKLREAAEEVRAATRESLAASGLLTPWEESKGQVSLEFDPLLDKQAKVLEHIAKAIELLSPPPPQKPQDQKQQDQKKQDQQKQDQKQDQQKQDGQDPQAGEQGEKKEQKGQKPDKPDKPESSADADRRLETVREREAERERRRREQQMPRPEPVEKDW